MTEKIDLTKLSDRAKAAASMFAMMPVGRERSALTFQMVEGKPSPQMQAALDELVEKGVVRREDLKPLGVSYFPLVECRDAMTWLGRNTKNPDVKFPVTVPVDPKDLPPGLRRDLARRAKESGS